MIRTHETRQRLLDTAQALFYARSYEGVGVQEICRQAGVKKGSFYHFFPSKRDLTLAVLDESWNHFRDTILHKAFARDVPPLQRIKRLMELQYRHHVEVRDKTGHVYGCPFGNLAGELSTRDESIRKRLKAILSDFRQPVQEALDEAVAAGDLAQLDTQATASAMVAYIEGLTLVAKANNDPEVVRKLGPAILKLATVGDPG